MITPAQLSTTETILMYVGAAMSGWFIGSLIPSSDVMHLAENSPFLLFLLLFVTGVGSGLAWLALYLGVIVPLVRGWNGQ